MGVVGAEQSLCACYKECQEFHKVLDLKDAGLVVYCHTTHKENVIQGGVVGSALSASQDVFILHNTKDVKITAAEIIPALERNDISCPRCRQIFEHAHELLQNLTSIDKKNVMGVCDHCLIKAQFNKKPCYECKEIVKKFMLTRGEQKEDTKRYIKIWLSKMSHLFKDDATSDKRRKARTRAHSESQIDRLCQHSSRLIREPEVKQMFHSESDTNLQTGIEDQNLMDHKLGKSVVFTERIEPSQSNLMKHGPSLGSDTICGEPYDDLKKSRKISPKDNQEIGHITGHYDDSTININEALKKSHDANLRLMMRLQREIDSEKYEIPKIAPWEQETHMEKQDQDSKYDKSAMDEKITTERKQNLNSKPLVTPETQRLAPNSLSQKGSRESRRRKNATYDSQEIPKKMIKQEAHLTEDDIKFQQKLPKYSHDKEKSGEQLKKTTIKRKKTVKHEEPTDNKVKPQFSYFFPRGKKKEAQIPKLDARSSRLIKNTQEKLRQQEEDEKKRQAVDQKKKLEEDEQKKLTRMEKKRLAEEKKKLAGEQQSLSEKKEGQQVFTKKEIVKPMSEQDLNYISKSTNKLDKDAEKSQKELKLKRDKETGDIKKDFQGKRESRDKNYELSEKVNKHSKLKAEKEEKIVDSSKDKALKKYSQDKIDTAPEKDKKESQSKSKSKLIMDKETEKMQKEVEKQERMEKLKRDQEEKDRLKQIAQLRKEKETSANKKQDSPKETEGASKKKLDPAKQKESSSKKAKDLSKEEELVEDFSKKKRESADEKELLPKGKQKLSTKKEEVPKVSEDSKKVSTKLSDAPKKPKDGMDEAQFRKLQAELKKEKEEQLRKKKQQEADEQKARDLADKKMKEEAERKLKNVREAKAEPKKDLEQSSELDVESYDSKMNIQSETAEIIIGEKIFKYKPPLLETIEEQQTIPLLFQSTFVEKADPLLSKEIVKMPEKTERKTVLTALLPNKDTKGTLVEQESGKGIVRYALSDRTFIDKGWTMLPTEKVVRKMNVYRMRPAHPEFDWFEHNKNKRLMNYDCGEKLAEFDDNGRGRWYYRSGRLALDYYDAEETNAQQRFVLYSSGEPDERGRTHPITILATFDYLGNGIVFDHAGKIRLKYNQTEGVVLDRGIGPVSHWKWHTLNDPPVLQQVMIDTQMAHKDPAIIKLGTSADNKTRPDNEEMLAIEFDNFIKEKSKKLCQKFKPFQIKMKAMKINEHFSLKVLDQATIYLIFRDGSTNLKLNIGMILDHQEIVDTDTAEVGEVSNNLERFPARTDSLAGLQRSVAYAQRYERLRTERERRLRPPEPCRSADQITAAASPPLRPPLRTAVPTGSTTSAGYCRCRKSSNNLYYNTRLL